jgi:hypothetical protein
MNVQQKNAALAAIGGVANLQTIVTTNLGRRVEVGGPLGAINTVVFDDTDQVANVTMQSGQVLSFGYDQIVELLGNQSSSFQNIPFDIWTQVGKQWKP